MKQNLNDCLHAFIDELETLATNPDQQQVKKRLFELAEEYGARKSESPKFAEMEELSDNGRHLIAQYPKHQYECIMGIHASAMGNYKLASDYGIKLLEEDERRAKADFLSAGIDIEISDSII